MKKLIIPAFVMLIRAEGAYATDLASNDESALIPKQGYIYNLSTNQYDPEVMCRTEPGPVCTVNWSAFRSASFRYIRSRL